MLQSTFFLKWLCFTTLLLGMMLSAETTHAGGNKKLMSIKKAKVMAQRAIVESVIGLKIRSQSLWTNDAAEDNYAIRTEVSATIKGITLGRPKYDKAKDIAMVTATIRLGSIENIIGKRIKYDDIVLSRVGFATSTAAYAPQLSALRAAELSAYDELAQLIVGQKIDSKTSVKNFVLESDEVRTQVLAAIWGAEVKDFGWEDDGTAHMTLRLNPKWVRDATGKLNQNPQDQYLEVTGYGATHDELETTSNKASFVKQKSSVDEVTFDIPANTPAQAGASAIGP